MSLTQLGVILAGVWLILEGVEAGLTNTATLIFGIAIVVLVLIDNRGYFESINRRPAP